MDFIATYWFLWLIGMIGFGVLTLVILFKRARSFGRAFVRNTRDPFTAVGAAVGGFKWVLVPQLATLIFFGLLLVSVVANLIAYAQHVH